MAKISDEDSLEIRKLLAMLTTGVHALVLALCSEEQIKEYRENMLLVGGD